MVCLIRCFLPSNHHRRCGWMDPNYCSVYVAIGQGFPIMVRRPWSSWVAFIPWWMVLVPLEFSWLVLVTKSFWTGFMRKALFNTPCLASHTVVHSWPAFASLQLLTSLPQLPSTWFAHLSQRRESWSLAWNPDDRKSQRDWWRFEAVNPGNVPLRWPLDGNSSPAAIKCSSNSRVVWYNFHIWEITHTKNSKALVASKGINWHNFKFLEIKATRGFSA